MIRDNIKYKTKTAPENKILLHLTECGDDFIPPLSERVDINEYAKKIFKKSVTFEAWASRNLVGIVAAYFNNINGSVFITNVSVLRKFVGCGIASSLLNMCVDYARENNFREINLEVYEKNSNAIGLYKKNSFVIYETKGGVLLMKRQI